VSAADLATPGWFVRDESNEDSVSALGELLDPDSPVRVVGLYGATGTGKSALLRLAAAQERHVQRGGVRGRQTQGSWRLGPSKLRLGDTGPDTPYCAKPSGWATAGGNVWTGGLLPPDLLAGMERRLGLGRTACGRRASNSFAPIHGGPGAPSVGPLLLRSMGGTETGRRKDAFSQLLLVGIFVAAAAAALGTWQVKTSVDSLGESLVSTRPTRVPPGSSTSTEAPGTTEMTGSIYDEYPAYARVCIRDKVIDEIARTGTGSGFIERVSRGRQGLSQEDLRIISDAAASCI
jgi:hypothetical protein